MRLPLREFLHGCRIDFILDSSKKESLYKLLNDRRGIEKLIKGKIRELLEEIKHITGMEAHELLSQFTGANMKSLNPEDILYEIINHLSDNHPIEIDPFNIDNYSLSHKRKQKQNSTSLTRYRPYDLSKRGNQ